MKYGTPNRYQVKSNFGYNMQYLEYLQKQIEELNLFSVIITMVYKSYIIVAMGIIEMLFVSLLKATKNWKTVDKELVLTTTSNFQKHGKQELQTVTEIYKKVKATDGHMDFESMIHKVEKKGLLNVGQGVYPMLKKLKKLRNRVHLQECSNYTDHDYNNFDSIAFYNMKEILHKIITCDEFCYDASLYDFLLN